MLSQLHSQLEGNSKGNYIDLDVDNLDEEVGFLLDSGLCSVNGKTVLVVQAGANFYDNFTVTLMMAGKLAEKSGGKVDVVVAVDEWRLRDREGNLIIPIERFNNLDSFVKQFVLCSMLSELLTAAQLVDIDFTDINIKFRAQEGSNSNREILDLVQHFRDDPECGLLISMPGNEFLAKRLLETLEREGQEVNSDSFNYRLYNHNGSGLAAKTTDAVSLGVNRVMSAVGVEDFHDTKVYGLLAKAKWKIRGLLG